MRFIIVFVALTVSACSGTPVLHAIVSQQKNTNALVDPGGVGVAAPVAFPAFTVEPRASLIVGLSENDLGGARYVEGDAEIAPDHAFDFSFASLALGGFLGASLVHQDFD